MSLDFTNKELKEYINYAASIIEELYGKKLGRRVFAGKSSAEVASLFDEKIPEQGLDPAKILEKVRTDIIGSSTLNIGPNFYGYITGGGNQVAVLAEMISAALNQNNLKWPFFGLLEYHPVDWSKALKGIVSWPLEILNHVPASKKACPTYRYLVFYLGRNILES